VDCLVILLYKFQYSPESKRHYIMSLTGMLRYIKTKQGQSFEESISKTLFDNIFLIYFQKIAKGLSFNVLLNSIYTLSIVYSEIQ